MNKKLILAGLCLLSVYLFFSAFFFKDKPKEGECTGFEVVVKNSRPGMLFVDTMEVVRYIKGKGLNPVGKQIKEVNTIGIENAILDNHLIKEAQAYITDNGAIKVNLVERRPVLRVMPNQGESYYIDSDGHRMALSKFFTAHLPIATGAIKESFAKEELYKFALFLSEERFWDAQVEQIVVEPNNEVRLIPRVGNQEIILGKLDNFEEKLDKLMNFYTEGQNRIGWNKYSVINLKFDKQVVATKR